MHYRDGTEAKMGDQVKGQPYNTPHPVVGTVVGLVPGVESCNLRVAFLEVGPIGTMPTPQMALAAGACWQGQGTETEPGAAMFPCVDYGDTKAFELIARAGCPLLSATAGDAKDRILQFFDYAHLPEKMQAISRPFGELAQGLVNGVPSNHERTVALRKLLEAKDAAVRATIYKEPA